MINELHWAESVLRSSQVSASQEIPHILRNPKVHYLFRKSPPPAPVLSQFNPVRTPVPLPEDPLYYYPTPTPGSPSVLFPQVFPTKTLSHIRAISPVHPILLDFINRIVFGGERKSLSSSLFSLLYSLLTSCFLGPHVLCSTLFFKTLSTLSSVTVLHPHKTTREL